MDKVNPYNYQNNKVNEAIFKLNEMMEKLTIDHLIPYSNHKLGLMDLSSLGHIPTTMTLEGFDLHLKDKPLIAERTNWSLEEIKPILHPLSDLRKDEYKYIMVNGCFTLHDFVTSDVTGLDKQVFKESIKWYNWLLEHHFDVSELIEKGLAIDFNTLK